MRVLVTGGHGFLGSALCPQLRLDGFEVMAPKHTECDLRYAPMVDLCFSKNDPDVVVHLAANVGGIGKNKRLPASLAYDNLLMGINVIHSCKMYRVRKLVVLGTICSYPKFCDVPFKEEDFWKGYPEETNAPYGIAKKALLVTGQAYRQQHAMNIVHLLMVNLYGPRDNFDLEDSHVIPALIRKFHEAKEKERPVVHLWGDGTPTREFLFVRDAAKAISAAVRRYDSGEPINIGNGQEVSILELAEQIKAITDYKGEIVWDTSKPNGQPRRCLDVSKAESFLGWTAETTLRDGLEETYSWWLDKGREPLR